MQGSCAVWLGGEVFPKFTFFFFFSLSRCNGEAPHWQGKSDAISEVPEAPAEDLDAESILPKRAHQGDIRD